MLLGRYAATANHGRLPLPVAVIGGRNRIPTGPLTRTPPIADPFWKNVWDNPKGLPAGLPRVTSNSPDLRRPWDRLYERFGSSTNPSHFIILRDAVNAAKGRIENFVRPMDPDVLLRHVRRALTGNEPSIEDFMSPLREVSPLLLRVKLHAVNN
jgi:chitinase